MPKQVTWTDIQPQVDDAWGQLDAIEQAITPALTTLQAISDAIQRIRGQLVSVKTAAGG